MSKAAPMLERRAAGPETRSPSAYSSQASESPAKRRGRSLSRGASSLEADQVITRDALGYELRCMMSEIQEQLCSRVAHAVRSEAAQQRRELQKLLEAQGREARRHRDVEPEAKPQRAASRLGDFGAATHMPSSDNAQSSTSSRTRASTTHEVDQTQHPRDSSYTLVGSDACQSEVDNQSIPPEHEDNDVPLDRAGLEPEVKAYLRDVAAEERAEREAKEQWAVANCYGFVAQLVRNHSFDYAIGFLTVVNAIAIGAQTEYMSQHLLDVPPYGFRIVDLVFAVLFGTEIVLRMVVYKGEFFTMDGWRWNLFDTTVVGLQVVEEVLQRVTNKRSKTPPNFAAFRVLRVLRLVRILRLVRVLRLVAELRRIVFSFVASLRPFCITFALLIMTIYVTSVCLTQLILDRRILQQQRPSESTELIEQYYCSLGRTMLTLFETVAGGLSWDVAVDPLVKEISPVMGIVFPFYVAFAVFAIGNVITGVFVESLLENAKETRDLHALDSIRATFLAADSDGSGTVCYEEFQEQLKDESTQNFLRDLDLQISEAENMFRLFDHNGDGELQMEAFIRGFLNVRGSAKSVDLRLLSQDVRRLTERFLAFAALVETHIFSAAEASALADRPQRGFS